MAKRKASRIVSLVVAVSLLFTSPGFSTPPQSSSSLNLTNISLPPEWGSVSEVYKGSSDNVIVHIQDAHTNYDAQKNTARIIEHLITQYGVDLTLVEGGSGNLNLRHLRRSVPSETRVRIADSYLKSGLISGEEYLDIASDLTFDIEGIEDKDLYLQNYASFRKSGVAQREFRIFIDHIKKAMGKIKTRFFPKELLDLERKLEASRDDGQNTLAYYQALAALADARKMDYSDAVEFSRLLRMAESEKEIQRDVLTKEYQRFRSDTLPEELPHSPGFFEPFLENHTLNKDRYPELFQYAHFLSDVHRTEMDGAISKEVESLKDRVYDMYLKSNSVKDIYTLEKNMKLFQKLIENELSPEEYEYYTLHHGQFHPSFWLDALKKFSKTHDMRLDLPWRTPLTFGLLVEQGGFYRSAMERDQAFLKNIMAIMSEKNRNAAVLIAGGFHTAKLTEDFRKQDISYVVVTPRIEMESEPGLYEKVLEYKFGSKNPEVLRRFKLLPQEYRTPGTAQFGHVVMARLSRDLEAGSVIASEWPRFRGQERSNPRARRLPRPLRGLAMTNAAFGVALEESEAARGFGRSVYPAGRELFVPMDLSGTADWDSSLRVGDTFGVRDFETTKTHPHLERAFQGGRMFAVSHILGHDFDALFRREEKITNDDWERLRADIPFFDDFVRRRNALIDKIVDAKEISGAQAAEKRTELTEQAKNVLTAERLANFFIQELRFGEDAYQLEHEVREGLIFSLQFASLRDQLRTGFKRIQGIVRRSNRPFLQNIIRFTLSVEETNYPAITAGYTEEGKPYAALLHSGTLHKQGFEYTPTIHTTVGVATLPDDVDIDSQTKKSLGDTLTQMILKEEQVLLTKADSRDSPAVRPTDAERYEKYRKELYAQLKRKKEAMLNSTSLQEIFPLSSEVFFNHNTRTPFNIQTILDNEDSVAPIMKRQGIREAIKVFEAKQSNFYGKVPITRVNNVRSRYIAADLYYGIRRYGDKLMAVYLPKVESEEDIIEVDKILTLIELENGWAHGVIKIFGMIESARGVVNVNKIASASPRVIGLLSGLMDYISTLHGFQLQRQFPLLNAQKRAVIEAANRAGILYIDSITSVLQYKPALSDKRNAYKKGARQTWSVHPLHAEAARDLAKAGKVSKGTMKFKPFVNPFEKHGSYKLSKRNLAALKDHPDFEKIKNLEGLPLLKWQAENGIPIIVEDIPAEERRSEAGLRRSVFRFEIHERDKIKAAAQKMVDSVQIEIAADFKDWDKLNRIIRQIRRNKNVEEVGIVFSPSGNAGQTRNRVKTIYKNVQDFDTIVLTGRSVSEDVVRVVGDALDKLDGDIARAVDKKTGAIRRVGGKKVKHPIWMMVEINYAPQHAQAPRIVDGHERVNGVIDRFSNIYRNVLDEYEALDIEDARPSDDLNIFTDNAGWVLIAGSAKQIDVIGGLTPDSDVAGRHAHLLADMGFRGKLVKNPDQLDDVNFNMDPDPVLVAEAHDAVHKLYEWEIAKGEGAIQYEARYGTGFDEKGRPIPRPALADKATDVVYRIILRRAREVAHKTKRFHWFDFKRDDGGPDIPLATFHATYMIPHITNSGEHLNMLEWAEDAFTDDDPRILTGEVKHGEIYLRDERSIRLLPTNKKGEYDPEGTYDLGGLARKFSDRHLTEESAAKEAASLVKKAKAGFGYARSPRKIAEALTETTGRVDLRRLLWGRDLINRATVFFRNRGNGQAAELIERTTYVDTFEADQHVDEASYPQGPVRLPSEEADSAHFHDGSLSVDYAAWRAVENGASIEPIARTLLNEAVTTDEVLLAYGISREAGVFDGVATASADLDRAITSSVSLNDPVTRVARLFQSQSASVAGVPTVSIIDAHTLLNSDGTLRGLGFREGLQFIRNVAIPKKLVDSSRLKVVLVNRSRELSADQIRASLGILKTDSFIGVIDLAEVNRETINRYVTSQGFRPEAFQVAHLDGDTRIYRRGFLGVDNVLRIEVQTPKRTGQVISGLGVLLVSVFGRTLTRADIVPEELREDLETMVVTSSDGTLISLGVLNVSSQDYLDQLVAANRLIRSAA